MLLGTSAVVGAVVAVAHCMRRWITHRGKWRCDAWIGAFVSVAAQGFATSNALVYGKSALKGLVAVVR